MIAATIDKFGRLVILVNNAGIQFTAPVDEFPPAKWQAILDINLSAAFHGIATAVPHMKKSAGDGSSTSPLRTASSPQPTRRPMSQRSTVLSASPRWSAWRPPAAA